MVICIYKSLLTVDGTYAYADLYLGVAPQNYYYYLKFSTRCIIQSNHGPCSHIICNVMNPRQLAGKVYQIVGLNGEFV